MIIKAPQVYWSPCPTTPTMRAKPVCQPSALSQGQYSINISHFYATKSKKKFIFINFSIYISQGQYKDFLWLSYHFTRSSNKSPGRSWLSLRTGFLKRTWRPRRKQRKEPKTLRWVRYVDTKWRRCISSGIFFPNISQMGKNVSHPRIWGKIWVAISGVLIKVKLGKMIDFVFYNWIFVILLRFFNPSTPVQLRK